jgi:hypothetical protein
MPSQTVVFPNPPVISNLITQANVLPTSLTSQTVKANKVFIGGVQIIKPPNVL